MKYWAVMVWVVFWTSVFIVAIWQHDLLCVEPVWERGWGYRHSNVDWLYAEQYFKCWVWEGTIGEAYDGTLFWTWVSYFMAMAGLATLTIKQHEELKRIKSQK